jgi:hypothetical protein
VLSGSEIVNEGRWAWWSDDLRLTHEFIASMPGARRTGVPIAAGSLQKAGLIRYSRGRVTLLDVKGLTASACDCYPTSKAEFDRVGLGL